MQNNKKKADKKKPNNIVSIVAIAAVFIAVIAFSVIGNFNILEAKTSKIAYAGGEVSFKKNLKQNNIKNITYQPTTGEIAGEFIKEPKGFTKEFTAQGPQANLDETTIALIESKRVKLEYGSTQESILPSLIVPGIMLALIIGAFVWMNKKQQGQVNSITSIGKNKGKVYSTEKTKITFDDVAGYGPVKKEIKEVVDFLKHPDKFKDIGAKVPRGVLLVGPPGTGKTLIAKAVAGEANVPFTSVTGSDFMEMFVGVGAARVRDLFANARKNAPAIIFIDEIDSIGRKRGAGVGGGHDEREQTLNQMLAEMDGFETTDNVIMIAATNRPDILDPALLRPGRFDRQVMVPLPTLGERTKIIEVHLNKKKIDAHVNAEIIARGTPGMSGADLANLTNEAALFAVRRGSTEITMGDFDQARDRIYLGLKRESLILSDKEKEMVAYHEGGHALCAFLSENADPVHKVTIVSRGMALGLTHQLPENEVYLQSRDAILDTITVLMGGRVAEELIFGQRSTGASNDLQRATEIARSMVQEYGMSEEVGPMSWNSSGQVFLGDSLTHSREYSEDTAHLIDQEARAILVTQENHTRELLTKNLTGLKALAEALLEKETVSGKEVTEIINSAMAKK